MVNNILERERVRKETVEGRCHRIKINDILMNISICSVIVDSSIKNTLKSLKGCIEASRWLTVLRNRHQRVLIMFILYVKEVMSIFIYNEYTNGRTVQNVLFF